MKDIAVPNHNAAKIQAIIYGLRQSRQHALRKNIQIIKGATREQKAQLVKDITDSLVRVLGKKPEHTHIVIQEINEEDWGFSGLLTDVWEQQK
ncbi:MAG: tautomerase family protein [Acidithiobacillus ferrivorans]